jgi:hypothetical protein
MQCKCCCFMCASGCLGAPKTLMLPLSVLLVQFFTINTAKLRIAMLYVVYSSFLHTVLAVPLHTHCSHKRNVGFSAVYKHSFNRGLVLQGNSGTWTGAPTWNGARIVPSSLVPPPPAGSSAPVGGRTALLVDEVSAHTLTISYQYTISVAIYMCC